MQIYLRLHIWNYMHTRTEQTQGYTLIYIYLRVCVCFSVCVSGYLCEWINLSNIIIAKNVMFNGSTLLCCYSCFSFNIRKQ